MAHRPLQQSELKLHVTPELKQPVPPELPPVLLAHADEHELTAQLRYAWQFGSVWTVCPLPPATLCAQASRLEQQLLTTQSTQTVLVEAAYEAATCEHERDEIPLPEPLVPTAGEVTAPPLPAVGLVVLPPAPTEGDETAPPLMAGEDVAPPLMIGDDAAPPIVELLELEKLVVT